MPSRSEDDFLLANQPIGLPWSIRRTRTIFAGKKLKYEPRNRVNLKNSNSIILDISLLSSFIMRFYE